jgi:prolyl-tRNA editing enzyme YbaK/EbsC (Cys-tRNA(Pro) deacylase)
MAEPDPDSSSDEPALNHPTVRRVSEWLTAVGVRGAVVALPESAPTAAAAAAQLGCPVGAIANSLVFDARGQPVLVMTSGAHRVDPPRLAAMLEVSHVDKASADFVRHHTGMAIGGVAPVGHPRPLRTLVDVDLAQFDVVWAAAGHPHTVFPTSYDELLRITGGVSAEVS